MFTNVVELRTIVMLKKLLYIVYKNILYKKIITIYYIYSLFFIGIVIAYIKLKHKTKLH